MAINVIIPIKDTDPMYFEQCLYSLATQTKKTFLTTVVDDGSTEKNFSNYIKIIDKMPFNVMLLRHEKSKGPGPARQLGIDKAIPPADYFFFLDSDDLLYPNTFKILYQEAKVNKEPDIIIGGVFIEGEHPSQDGVVPNKITSAWITGKLFKRSFLESNDIRFLDRKMLGAEDSYFGLVASNLSNKNLFVDRELYYWRHNEQSVTRNPDNNFIIESNVDHTYSQYAGMKKIMQHKPDWNFGGILGVIYNNYQYAQAIGREDQLVDIKVILNDLLNLPGVKERVNIKEIIEKGYTYIEHNKNEIEFADTFLTWRKKLIEGKL